MKTTALLLLTALLCTACGPGTTRPENLSAPDQQARQMLAAHNFRAAAQEFLRLAGLYPKQESSYQLEAAQSLLEVPDADAAGKLLAGIKPAGKAESVHRELLLARLALLRNRPAEALSLSAEPVAGGTGTLADLRSSVRAAAFEMKGDAPAAIRERIALSRRQPDIEAAGDNLTRLWADLQSLPDEVAPELAGPDADADTRAWVELAQIARALITKPAALESAVNTWSAAHAGHAAIPFITGQLLELARQNRVGPEHVALLLPLSGQYGQVSEAIRDGFLAAWYSGTDYQPDVSIYDTNSLNVIDQYRKAVADGADFVVGPLEKPAVAALRQSDALTVPTLALNRHELKEGNSDTSLPGADAPRMYQFSLSPEDEAQLAAERAFFEGHTRALVIAPETDWGRRLATAFQSHWVALGGQVLESVTYTADSNDFSRAVRELLNVDSSEARNTALRHLLGRALISTPRVRQDADMIFMAAPPVAARQIVPQFRFFGVEDLPVYATSSVYTGIVSPQTDGDMNGVRFPDMPWVLEPESEQSALEKTVDRNWSAATSVMRRMYAFGADAFRIIPQLRLLASQGGANLRGETGDLYVTPDGIVHRKLLWANFVDGIPSLIDAAGPP